MITKLSRHVSNVVRWLQSATADDTRPVLSGIRCNKYSVACDGLRIHATPEPVVEVEDGTIKILDFGKVRAGESLVETVEIPGKYPDIEAIVPQGKPTLTIAFNPRLLLDALKGFDKGTPCIMSLYGDNHPFEVCGIIKSKDESTPAYALIMPMDKDQAKAIVEVWKPTNK